MATSKKQSRNSVSKANVVTEAPVENKLPEDETFATPMQPDANMKAAAEKEAVVPVSELAPKFADSVAKGDEPPRKLKKGEVYLGQGSIMVNN